jgi:NTE family protein
MREHFDAQPIEALATRFAAVATALHTGEEVWLRSGSVSDAVRASFALPGLFTPVWRDQRLLVDGGLVNPVPVSLARALGADVVIAVDLNHDKLGRYFRGAPPAAPEPDAPPDAGGGWVQSLQQGWARCGRWARKGRTSRTRPGSRRCRRC